MSVPTSSARLIDYKHAEKIHLKQQEDEGLNNFLYAPMIIAQTDGTMVPIVTQKDFPNDADPIDKRKNKELIWKEARLTLAHTVGSKTPVFAANLGEFVSETGKQMRQCVNKIGYNEERTHVHFLGDGAPWIQGQVEEQFGTQATYLVDFYHTCDYLAAASRMCDPEAPSKWLEIQKNYLKSGELDRVLIELKAHEEDPSTPEGDAPVRQCYRYISNRRMHMNYKKALDQGLPIGSGEIESAHRYIIQKRLKIAGAWWKEDHARKMLSLRTRRANKEWESYWGKNLAA